MCNITYHFQSYKQMLDYSYKYISASFINAFKKSILACQRPRARLFVRAWRIPEKIVEIIVPYIVTRPKVARKISYSLIWFASQTNPQREQGPRDLIWHVHQTNPQREQGPCVSAAVLVECNIRNCSVLCWTGDSLMRRLLALKG